MQATHKELGAPGSITERWEETRDSLASALINYLDSCISLQASHHDAKALASLIDPTLESLQGEMTRQLAQSTFILARTRNRVAPIWNLPGEILAKVFLNAVYRPEYESLTMEQYLLAMYCSRHRLMAVCSSWRSVIVAQSQFWGIVPAIGEPTKRLAVDLSVERSRGGPLRLATILPSTGAPPFLIKIATENSSRIRALNVQCIDPSHVSDMIAQMLRGGALGQLSELSVRDLDQGYGSCIKPAMMYLDPAEQEGFSQLIKSLSILRLGSVQIDWKPTVFSSQLTELHIQKIQLGSTSLGLPEFLQAISTANELHTLKLASITVFRPYTYGSTNSTTPQATFPKLQLLQLSDLYFDVLQGVLLLVAPGSYHLRLDIFDSAFRMMRADFHFVPERVDIDDMVSLLSRVRVDTLLLFRGSSKTTKVWLSGSDLRKILVAIPGLKALNLGGWVLDGDFCNGLNSPSTPEEHALPKLELLNVTRSIIWDVEGLKTFVTNTSVRKMDVGGGIRGRGREWIVLKGDNDLVGWLRSKVPSFRLVHPRYISPEFKAINAMLW